MVFLSEPILCTNLGNFTPIRPGLARLKSWYYNDTVNNETSAGGGLLSVPINSLNDLNSIGSRRELASGPQTGKNVGKVF